jgi:hypothetical protein
MSTLAEIRAIADLEYSPDPETDGGYVAEVGSGLLARSYEKQLTAAGFEASSSRDDAWRWYVWVA